MELNKREQYLWTQKPEVQKIYTTNEIALLLNTSAAIVRNIVGYYNIPHSIAPTGNSRAAYYSYDTMRIIKQYYEAIQNRADAHQKALLRKKLNEEENEAEENDHPLVTDKRFLKLSYFPDVIPECFKES